MGEDVARTASSDVAVGEVLSLWEVKAALPLHLKHLTLNPTPA